MDKKHIHFTVPAALYEDFHRLFPERGEKTVFLTRVIEIAVEMDYEGKDAFAVKVMNELERRGR